MSLLWKVLLQVFWFTNAALKPNLGRRERAADPLNQLATTWIPSLVLTEIASFLLLVNTAAVIYTAVNSAFFPHVIFVFSNSVCLGELGCWQFMYSLGFKCGVVSYYKAPEITVHPLKIECSGCNFLKTGLEWHKQQKQLGFYIISQKVDPGFLYF